MTIAQFKELDINGQADAVWNGTFLNSRVEAKYNIHLYNVSNFYVQVYYSNKLNEIVKIRPSMSTMFVQPFLDSINLDHLQA